MRFLKNQLVRFFNVKTFFCRKRLRKSSTGSGSGSTDRTSEEQQTSTISENKITSPGLNLATVIKPDPGGFTSDSNNTLRSKQHSSDSDLHRGSSHESVESEPPHQITLVSKGQFLFYVIYLATMETS